MTAEKRICLVGAGAIAETHAHVIAQSKTLRLAAVVEPNDFSRSRFLDARREAREHVSAGDAIAAGGFDAVHILTPPPTHAEIAAAFLEARIPTLVEKPLGHDVGACAMLRATAERSGARLGVNQNFLYDPAFRQLRKRVEAGEIGPLRHISATYRAPLRQIAAKRFDHWMFRSPLNMLLEQAVHPLSQLRALGGEFGDASAGGVRMAQIDGARDYLRAFTAAIEMARATASLHFAVGESYPVWRIDAFGADGVISADIYAQTCILSSNTKWMEPVDRLAGGLRSAASQFGSAIAGISRYSLSQFRLASRSDAFFRSMTDSIEAFHQDTPFEADASFGEDLVRFCTLVAERISPSPKRVATTTKSEAAPDKIKAADVALIGGTGFIGAYVVKALLDQGHSIAVMARNVDNPQPVFNHPSVQLVQGDARSKSDVRGLLQNTTKVVNLAHGGGGGTYEEIRAAMLRVAENAAEAALECGLERLVHVGSIASLYLGADAGTVYDDADPDPHSSERAGYARAKADADRRMLDRKWLQHLPVVLLRPGLVVGAGASPFHSGLGVFNNERHCIGWNEGRNPLPFVLARDVASAIVSALTADAAVGRSYNIVGDVRPTAREYIEALKENTGRPLRFHASSPTVLWGGEIFKWSVKRIGGRETPFPSARDIVSRGLGAVIDTTAAKRDLSWRPESNRERFFEEAFADLERT